jgi:DNA-binding transcriptional LysR family regulator
MCFDLIDLRLFLHVAEARSITHGARRSNLALASASARIRGMEQKLGVALLTRDRRGVSLTQAGQSVVDHARLILRQVESLQGELGVHARGLTGTVRVLSNTAAFSEHLPKLLASFLAKNPAISVDLEERESSDIGALIASGSGDIGIASETALSDAVETLPFPSAPIASSLSRPPRTSWPSVGRSVSAKWSAGISSACPTTAPCNSTSRAMRHCRVLR